MHVYRITNQRARRTVLSDFHVVIVLHLNVKQHLSNLMQCLDKRVSLAADRQVRQLINRCQNEFDTLGH